MKSFSADIRDRVIKLHLEKKSLRQIAKFLLISKSTAGNIISQFKKTGSIVSAEKPKRGPKQFLSEREKRNLNRASISDPLATARQIQKEVGGYVATLSLRSVQRYLKRIGRFAFRPRSSPKWTKRQRQVRKQWCRDHKDVSLSQWKEYVFSDETYVDCHLTPRPMYVRRSKNESIRQSHCIPRRSFVKRTLIWGCITPTGTGPLEILNGTMTAAKYIST